MKRDVKVKCAKVFCKACKFKDKCGAVNFEIYESCPYFRREED